MSHSDIQKPTEVEVDDEQMEADDNSVPGTLPPDQNPPIPEITPTGIDLIFEKQNDDECVELDQLKPTVDSSMIDDVRSHLNTIKSLFPHGLGASGPTSPPPANSSGSGGSNCFGGPTNQSETPPSASSGRFGGSSSFGGPMNRSEAPPSASSGGFRRSNEFGESSSRREAPPAPTTSQRSQQFGGPSPTIQKSSQEFGGSSSRRDAPPAAPTSQRSQRSQGLERSTRFGGSSGFVTSGNYQPLDDSEAPRVSTPHLSHRNRSEAPPSASSGGFGGSSCFSGPANRSISQPLDSTHTTTLENSSPPHAKKPKKADPISSSDGTPVKSQRRYQGRSDHSTRMSQELQDYQTGMDTSMDSLIDTVSSQSRNDCEDRIPMDYEYNKHQKDLSQKHKNRASHPGTTQSSQAANGAMTTGSKSQSQQEFADCMDNFLRDYDTKHSGENSATQPTPSDIDKLFEKRLNEEPVDIDDLDATIGSMFSMDQVPNRQETPQDHQRGPSTSSLIQSTSNLQNQLHQQAQQQQPQLMASRKKKAEDPSKSEPPTEDQIKDFYKAQILIDDEKNATKEGKVIEAVQCTTIDFGLSNKHFIEKDSVPISIRSHYCGQAAAEKVDEKFRIAVFHNGRFMWRPETHSVVTVESVLETKARIQLEKAGTYTFVFSAHGKVLQQKSIIVHQRVPTME